MKLQDLPEAVRLLREVELAVGRTQRELDGVLTALADLMRVVQGEEDLARIVSKDLRHLAPLRAVLGDVVVFRQMRRRLDDVETRLLEEDRARERETAKALGEAKAVENTFETILQKFMQRR